MAALRELPHVIRSIGPFTFAKKVYNEVNDDNLWTWASALAYSWLFAIFPFFLVLLSLIPLLRPEWKAEASNQINNALKTLPNEAQVTLRQYVEPKLNDLLYAPPKGITGIWSVGLLVTIWAASGGTAMTMSALDRCYDVVRTRPFYKQRPLAVMLTLIIATLILLVVVLIPVGTIVTNYLTSRTEKLMVQTGLTKPATPGKKPAEVSATAPTTAGTTRPLAEAQVQQPGRFAAWIVLWQIARYLLALAFLFWVVALIYYFGPNVKQKFHVFTPGSVFTVAVWVLLGATFRIYVDTFGKYGQTYGAVGGVIILLFFFYLDALVLLVGAEINAEVDAALRAEAHEREKPPPPKEVVETEPAKQTP
jgi:membrane protein